MPISLEELQKKGTIKPVTNAISLENLQKKGTIEVSKPSIFKRLKTGFTNLFKEKPQPLDIAPDVSVVTPEPRPDVSVVIPELQQRIDVIAPEPRVDLKVLKTSQERDVAVKNVQNSLSKIKVIGEPPSKVRGDLEIKAGLKTFGEGLLGLTPYTLSLLLPALQGKDAASVADKGWIDNFRALMQESIDNFIIVTEKKYGEGQFLPGIDVVDVAQVIPSLGFSVIAMGGGLGTGIATTLATKSPPAGWAAGTAVTGKLAFNMASYSIMQTYLEETDSMIREVLNRKITLEEENIIKEEIASLANEFGLWEAIPEAIAAASGLKILTSPLRAIFGKKLLPRMMTKLAALFGGELSTETITQLGQTGVEFELGLTEKDIDWTNPEDWKKAFQEIAPVTFLITGILGGAVTIQQRAKMLKREIGEEHPLYEKLEEKLKEVKKKEVVKPPVEVKKVKPPVKVEKVEPPTEVKGDEEVIVKKLDPKQKIKFRTAEGQEELTVAEAQKRIEQINIDPAFMGESGADAQLELQGELIAIEAALKKIKPAPIELKEEVALISVEKLNELSKKLFIKRNSQEAYDSGVEEGAFGLEKIEQFGREYNNEFVKKYPQYKDTSIIVYHDAIKGEDWAVVDGETNKIIEIYEPALLQIEEEDIRADELKTEDEIEAEKKGLILEAVKPKEGEPKAPKTLISKTQLKTLIKSSPEFLENPILTVMEKTIATPGKDAITQVVLNFKGKRQEFSIVPGALGLKTENLKIGDKIRVDLKKLIPAGPVRVIKVKKDGAREIYASIAKAGADFELTENELNNIGDPKIYKAIEKKLPRRSEIIKHIAKTLNIPIRRGRFSFAGAKAVYIPVGKLIRYKRGGVSTIFHETAHYLDDVYGFSQYFMGKGKVQMRQELMQEYGRKYKNEPRRQAKEAFAEFVRFYMTGRKEMVKKIAPGFYAEFDKRIDAIPEVRTLINDSITSFKRWRELPAAARILSHMTSGKENRKFSMAFFSEKIHEFYSAFKDDLHPIAQFVKAIKDSGVKVLDDANPYILARISRGWAGAANVFLNEGTFGKNYFKRENGKTKVVFKGKSLKAILMPIQVTKQLTNFKIYLTAKRAEELSRRNIETGISLKDAKETIRNYESKYPIFKKVAGELYTYQNHLLELMFEHGMLGADAMNKIKQLNKAYIPFYRVMEELDGEILKREGGVGKKFAENISPIKKIFGSDREIIDPLESVIKNTYAIVNSVKRYQVVRALVELAGKHYKGVRIVEKIDAPQKGIEINVKEVLKKAMSSILNRDTQAQEMTDILGEALEDVVTLFRPARSFGANNIIDIPIGDKRGYYRVDPMLYRSLQGIDNESIGVLTRIMAIPAKTLRGGAILTPEFSVRNPLRDTFMAAVYSKFRYIPGYDMFRGMFKVLRNYSGKSTDLYILWKIAGGDQSSLASMDRTTIKKNLEDILASKGKKAFKYVKNPLEALRILSELGEESTRLIEMESALNASGNPVAAAFASRDVTLDFWRKGSKMKALTRITAFMGPQIEGVDKMIREVKEHPIRFNIRAMTYITLPSILLWFINHDDERYKEIPNWQKNLFWIIITDEHIFRIPKPFELGMIYGSAPERILDHIFEKDPKAIENLIDSLVKGTTPPILPTALVPVLEAMTNYSFFLDRTVVSPGVEGLPAEAQYSTYTSDTAKYLGQLLGYPPMKIDHMIRGYFAGLGQHFIKMIDFALRKVGIAETPPKMPIEGADLPVLKAFMIREPIGSSSESVTRFYEIQREAESKLRLYNKMLKEGKSVEARDYFKANPIIKYNSQFLAVRTNFSLYNDQIDVIRRNDKLTPTERKDAIDEIKELMTEWAQKALNLYSK